MARQKPLSYLLAGVSMFAYAILGYGIQRHETLPLIGTYFVLFDIYLWLVKASPEEELKFWI